MSLHRGALLQDYLDRSTVVEMCKVIHNLPNKYRSIIRCSVMRIIETERLILRRLTAGDSEFMLALLNDPLWLRFIGDRGVRTLDDARDYILKNI